MAERFMLISTLEEAAYNGVVSCGVMKLTPVRGAQLESWAGEWR